jgi:hypothetical protein
MIVLLALPIFAAAGWPIGGWALGAGMWSASQTIGYVMNRRGIGAPTLKGSGPVAFGMMSRGIVIMVVAIVIAAFSPGVALAGALVYAAAYSIELGLSLTVYFQGQPKLQGPPDQ